MDYQLGPGPLQVDQNTIDEKIKGDIGIVENGDVATHAIPSGYYVIWKGDLYVAKTDISSGTTLSTSNLTAKPNGLGADVAALNSNLGDLSSRFFGTAYQGDTASINIEFPVIRTQMVWLLNVKHYTSNTTLAFDLYVIAKATDSTWNTTIINSNNPDVGKITSITNSGTTATITFDKNVWVTAQLVRLT